MELLDAFTTFFSEQPALTAIATLALLYIAAVWLRDQAGGTVIGAPTTSREEGMRAARQKQQEALLAAAEARNKCCAAAAPAPVPAPQAAEADYSDMPPRMKAALERKKRDEAAAKRQASEPLPATATAAPAPPGKKKETTAEKLARIEKGKGASDHSPLNPQASASSYQAARKGPKGG